MARHSSLPPSPETWIRLHKAVVNWISWILQKWHFLLPMNRH